MRIVSRVLVAGLALALLVAGCEPPLSTNPLSDPATAKADPRLDGVFGADLDGDAVWVHFSPRKESALVDVVLVGHDSREGAMVLHYEGFPTQIAGHGYLNLRAKTFPDMLESKFTLSTHYIFARYDFAKDGSITLAVMDGTPAGEAIRRKEIEGTIPDSESMDLSGKTAALTSDSATLAAWVAKADPKLFNVLGTFKKIDSSKLPKRGGK